MGAVTTNLSGSLCSRRARPGGVCTEVSRVLCHCEALRWPVWTTTAAQVPCLQAGCSFTQLWTCYSLHLPLVPQSTVVPGYLLNLPNDIGVGSFSQKGQRI